MRKGLKQPGTWGKLERKVYVGWMGREARVASKSQILFNAVFITDRVKFITTILLLTWSTDSTCWEKLFRSSCCHGCRSLMERPS